MNDDKLKEMLIRHEGEKLHAYLDTKGLLTLGVGHNIDKRGGGISKKISRFILNEDVRDITAQMDAQMGWWVGTPEGVQMALVDMAFMGVKKLLGFKKMFAALFDEDYVEAAKEALDSKWAREDVSRTRSQEIAQLIREG